MLPTTPFERWNTNRIKELSEGQVSRDDKSLIHFPLSLTSYVRIPVELKHPLSQMWSKQNAPEKEIEVCILFLKTILSSTSFVPNSRNYLLYLGYELTLRLIENQNIHTIASTLENPSDVVRTFNLTETELLKSSWIEKSHYFPSGLLKGAEEKKFGIFPIFGGQGVSWIRELSSLYQNYPIAQSLILQSIDQLLIQSRTDDAKQFLGRGTLINASWITEGDPVSWPDSNYLSSAPLSFPMICLTQLVHYYVASKIWKLSPESIATYYKGITGHSQGIISAVVVSASNSNESLEKNIIAAVKLSFWIGLRSQQAMPFSPQLTKNDMIKLSAERGHANPTPLLSVRNLNIDQLQKYIGQINFMIGKDDHRKISVALKNGPQNIVVAGHPETLHSLVEVLHKYESPASGPKDQKASQSRVPFSQRKLEPILTYIDVSSPFHSEHLQAAVNMIIADTTDSGISFSASDLQIPTYSTVDGSDLRKSSNLLLDIITMIVVKPLDWMKSLSHARDEEGVTHIIDFGPGEHHGIGSPTAHNINGSGVHVISASAWTSTRSNDFLRSAKDVLFETDIEKIPLAVHWGKKYQPRVIRRVADNKLFLDTKFSRVVGKPPLMVAGMTPSTVSWEFVSAIHKAGYHVELAGGGLPKPQLFREAIENVGRELSDGDGVTPNLLYLNRRLWEFQFATTIEMAKSGFPIDGLCVAAGTPSVEKSIEIMTSLYEAGLSHVSFKPANVASILIVVEAAKAVPQISVLLQWTGGRGGGHHSFEDFHVPILKTYAAIRSCDNIVLIAGSGFGDADGSYPYLTGEWSLKFEAPLMPFDAVLVASRVMTALECKTSDPAKQLLVDTVGVEDSHWETSYTKDAGGIITVNSDLNEPIHKVHTRALALWRFLDTKIFSLPKEKQLSKILELKNVIIQKLNDDYQKLYFGRTLTNQVVDLPFMTYQDVAYRMVELTCFSKSKKTDDVEPELTWVHEDHLQRVYEFCARTESRFARTVQLQAQRVSTIDQDEGKKELTKKASRLSSIDNLRKNPKIWLSEFFDHYPIAKTELLTTEDVDYFLLLCRKAGLKPVNFVPAIDNDLEFWFKRDSLWQSENLELVHEQDVGRVVILQGPLSVRHHKIVNEPVAQILNNIHDKWIQLCSPIEVASSSTATTTATTTTSTVTNGEKTSTSTTSPTTTPVTTTTTVSSEVSAKSTSTTEKTALVPTTPRRKSTLINYPIQDIEYLGLDCLDSFSSKGKKVFRFSRNEYPDISEDDFLNILSLNSKSWWCALISSKFIISNKNRRQNFIRQLFLLHPKQEIVISLTDDLLSVKRVEIFDSVEIYFEGNTKSSPFVTLDYEVSTRKIKMVLSHEFQENKKKSLTLYYQYNPTQSNGLIKEFGAVSVLNNEISSFYWNTWFGEKDLSKQFANIDKNPAKAIFQNEVVIKANDILSFCQAVKRKVESSEVDNKCRAPIDFAIVSAWESVCLPLFHPQININLLQLVHLNNSFKILKVTDEQLPFFVEQDSLSVKSKITEVWNTPTGLRIGVQAYLGRKNCQPLIEINSAFFVRGAETCEHTFKYFDSSFEISCTPEIVALLESKSFLSFSEKVGAKDELLIQLSHEHLQNGADEKNLTIKVTGEILKKGKLIGKVNYESGGKISKDIVLRLLKEYGKPLNAPNYFEKSLQAENNDVTFSPKENQTYSLASGDFNPIHTNQYFAKLAGLPDTITHGMWLSANAFRVLDKYKPNQIINFKTEFVLPVKPSEKLTTTLEHVGMRDGNLLFEIKSTENDITVLKGFAEVVQVKTAYVFTGQGSAEVKMGMALYETSKVAQHIWDSADRYFMDTYGFSILHIVNFNPKNITIFFGGEKGKKIRQNFMNLTQSTQVKEGEKFVSYEKKLFPAINEFTASYEFHHPDGLLFATQFSQPALVLVELSSFRDMSSHSLVPNDCVFAGHSLGEYAALSSVAQVLSIESLVDIVFLRGMTMQNAVERDKDGRSNYGMIAANPGRVHPNKFKHVDLQKVISEVSKKSPDKLLEIVNFNVQNYQYVVAGEVTMLSTLGFVLDSLKEDLRRMENLETIISESMKKTELKSDHSGRVVLERGQVTIPLQGIDVPFHSSFLKNGVPTFRQVLLERMKEGLIDSSKLVDRYIPNVVAKLFSLEEEFVKLVFQITNSEILSDVLKNFQERSKNSQNLAYVLLVELLAYQFATPVQWIQTQDLFFTSVGVERFIEIGPAPTLFTMAKRTLELGNYSPLVSREILWYGRDFKKIYFEPEESDSDQPQESKSTPPPVQQPIPQPQAPVIVPTANVEASSATPQNIPLEPLLVMKSVLALRTQKTISSIPNSVSIKDLCAGNSAMQNELVGDLQTEFGGSFADGSESIPLEQFSQQISNYTTHGKIMKSKVSKLVSSKMPVGFGLSNIKDYLKTKGLGDGSIDTVLTYAVTLEPKLRFASEQETFSWIDGVMSQAGITVSVSSNSPSASYAIQAQNPVIMGAFTQNFETLLKAQIDAISQYLGKDDFESERAIIALKELNSTAQAEIDLFTKEHGEFYLNGIKPIFDSRKVRVYNSSWNWVRQDSLILYYDYALGKLPNWNNATKQHVYHMKNRVTQKLVDGIEYCLVKAAKDGFGEITKFINILLWTTKESLDVPSRYRELHIPTSPSLSITEAGKINYKEVARRGVKNMEDFAEEMKKPAVISLKTITDFHEKDWVTRSAEYKELGISEDIISVLKKKKETELVELNAPPLIHLKSISEIDPTHQCYEKEQTKTYLNVMKKVATDGICFVSRVALVTGCGADSLGIEIVKGLLRGGAKVYATTSGFSAEKTKLYQQLYQKNGGRGGELIILPFNQASSQDIEALLKYIYSQGDDIDFIIPFAAISEVGRDIGYIDSRSELSHRIMLTNTIRLIGMERGITSRPAHVLLPLSPNHGSFGHDGLYAESKLGLESLLQKWKSEEWGNYLSIAGAIIGWTRGTGLMEQNNITAPGIEEMGVRTFSRFEMAFCLLTLLQTEVVEMAQLKPMLADLTGGMQYINELNVKLTEIRKKILFDANLKKIVTQDKQKDLSDTNDAPLLSQDEIVERAHVSVDFPPLPTKTRLAKLPSITNMLDLEKVVVVTGYGEFGPYGNARTRWDIEKNGKFSLEGCIELAWIMGLIEYHTKNDRNDSWCGWVDAVTKQPVKDTQILERYEPTILAHTGIRFVEPELFDDYDPMKKTFLHQIVLNETLNPIEVSEEEAENFKLKLGENVDIFTNKDGIRYMRVRKGANLYIPKALKFDRYVAGQIPSSWDPLILGIPEEIVNQVDRVTLFTLVSTVEALIASGVTDPYEFYKYVHVSEVGNAIGGGFGGMGSIRKTHRHRFLDVPIPSDTLQEEFANTAPAWINMLLLSSSGPIVTPVGACATAVESVQVGVDTITSGRAKIVVVGGYDDFGEEGSFEFAQMKATSNSKDEEAAGRIPQEMSRPTTTTRGGFMESHGAGVQVLMNAKIAIEMGVPIYAILAHVATATDKEGRSVPSPGQGILTTAREKSNPFFTKIMDLNFRKSEFESDYQQILKWKENMLGKEKEINAMNSFEVNYLFEQKVRKSQWNWCNDFYVNNPHISPLKGALAVYGLTVDDIDLASFHGTGTTANDLNETEVLQKQLEHLGRTKGNVIFSIFQKYLTGHPKGAAAAWMLNGLIQAMLSGVVPGNLNADNVDSKLREFDHVVFLNEPLFTYGFNSCILKSFGFGQVGGEVLIIHPDYLLAQLTENDYEVYCSKRNLRHQQSYRYFQNALAKKGKYVNVKNSPPYSPEIESAVYLNPLLRAEYNPLANTYDFSAHSKTISRVKASTEVVDKSPRIAQENPGRKKVLQRVLSTNTLSNLEVTLREIGSDMRSSADRGVGIDAQLISEIEVCINNSDTFLTRNFTQKEIVYCKSTIDPSSSFAGRWAAKEAVIKAISNCDTNENTRPLWKGSAAPLIDIEILKSQSGAPEVKLSGHAHEVVTLLGINSIKVSISHSGEYAIAQATAF